MTRIERSLVVAGCALTLLFRPDRALAQFTDPHSYDNTPVGVNQVELGYAFVHGNASIDPSLAIAGASLNLNQLTVDYTRYFGLARRVMWLDAAVPVAHLAGAVTGTSIAGSTAAAGDSSYALTMLLKSGPALTAAQFDDYMPTTALGVSVTVTAPTGQYNGDRVLDLGADRWSFKPEVALSPPFGPDQKWQLDAYVNTFFYTDNTSYHGREILRQEPLVGLEGHVSYSLNESLWVAVDTRFSSRGVTVVDGANQDNQQRNVIVGSEINLSITPRHSLLFEIGKSWVHQNSPDVIGFAVKYDFNWSRARR
jgi:hypothetical protein